MIAIKLFTSVLVAFLVYQVEDGLVAETEGEDISLNQELLSTKELPGVVAADSLMSKLLYTTARINCEDASGAKSSGTGFFFQLPGRGDDSFPALITNKHVVKGASKGSVVFHIANAEKDGASGELFGVNFENMENIWVMHPDEDVDLCAWLCLPTINEIREKKGNDLFIVWLTEKEILPDEELWKLQAVEEVHMIGYPIGLVDKQ